MSCQHNNDICVLNFLGEIKRNKYYTYSYRKERNIFKYMSLIKFGLFSLIQNKNNISLRCTKTDCCLLARSIIVNEVRLIRTQSSISINSNNKE